MANQVNQGFAPDTKGTKLKSTTVSVLDYSGQERIQVKNGSNNNLLKLAVVFIVILVVVVVVVAVFYAKEVRDNDDDDTTSSTTTKAPLTTSIPACLTDDCVQNAAGKNKKPTDLIQDFQLNRAQACFCNLLNKSCIYVFHFLRFAVSLQYVSTEHCGRDFKTDVLNAVKMESTEAVRESNTSRDT